MIRLIAFIIITLFTFSQNISSYDKNKSDFSLHIEQLDINNGVNIKLIFENNTNSDLKIYAWKSKHTYMCLGVYLFFDIFYENGKKLILDFTPLVKMPHKFDCAIIEPQSKFTDTIKIDDYYHFQNSDQWKTGKYEITARYKYNYSNTKFGKDFWEGMTESNTINIIL